MPPKKATGTAPKKASAPADHPPYKDMIKDAIIVLKERNGSSRQAIKKYVLNNNKGIKVSNFDTQFNAAIKRGVLAGDFVQPKGPSGPVKLMKKDASKATAKSTTDKPAKKASTTTKKAVAPKKAAAPKTAKPKTVTKPKTAVANSKKPRKTSSTEKPASNKTKTGRVSKAKASSTKKTPTTKKPASKKKAAEPAAASAE
jgi:histone H1/5